MYEVERLRQLGYNLNSKYLVHSIENYSYISSNGLGEFKYTINFTLKEDLKKDRPISCRKNSDYREKY